MFPRSGRYIVLLTFAGSVLCFLQFYNILNKVTMKDGIVASNGTVWPPKLEFHTEVPCEKLLDILTTDYVLILILDTSFADKFNKKMNCTGADYPPKIAVPKDAVGPWDKNILRFENDPKKNYYLIHDVDYPRAIYKFDYTTNYIWREYRNALLPRNITVFQELWRRSEIKNCLKNISEKHPSWNFTKVVPTMTTLVKYLMKYDMYPGLCCGTLLGWYRECGFIPYTTDVDFFYRAEEYNPDAFAKMFETEKPFPILFDWGKHKLNKEYSFATNPKIDLFEIVSSNGSSYAPVFIGPNSHRNVYPATYTSNCAADLYDHMFWIPCEPAIYLQADYGTNWTIREPDTVVTNTKNLVKIKGHSSAEFKEFGLRYNRG